MIKTIIGCAGFNRLIRAHNLKQFVSIASYNKEIDQIFNFLLFKQLCILLI